VKVLVAVASRHGSTREIAGAIAGELRDMGNSVEVREVATVESVAGYDAVIQGSAVYAGQWLPEARRFATRQRERLRALPVWLFSSGPIGAELWPPGDPDGVQQLVVATGAHAHVVFAGKLDRQTLGFAERLVARAVAAPEGDFRDWAAIRDWARGIGASLAAVPAESAP
jgi:menaquinone-dependent protoporphyrinogen oxidase